MLPSWMKYIVFPVIGGFLGYLTNWIAITLLFRPRRKIFGIQGLLERRKKLIAQKASEIISAYLLNTEEIKKVVDKKKVKESIDKLIDKSVIVYGKKIISKILREITYWYFFDKDGYIKNEMLELALSDADLEKIIIDKIENYDISDLEHIIKKASSTEINFILFSGAILGIIIGGIEAFLPF